MIKETLAHLSVLSEISANLQSFDDLNHRDGANFDDPSLRAAIKSVNRKYYNEKRKLPKVLKELAQKPTFYLNGAKISKTAVRALIGRREYEQMLQEAQAAFRVEPLWDNVFSFGFGNLRIDFFDSSDDHAEPTR